MISIAKFEKPLSTELSRSMHSERKRVFHDTMKWDVALVDDAYEVDQFDTATALYFMCCGKNKELYGSFRLLPTTRPHMLSEIFSYLCDGPVPCGEHVWEITRACVTPSVRAKLRLGFRNQLISACVDFALANSIDTYTCVVSAGFLAQILAMGWEVEPLGLPRRIDGVLTAALRISIDRTTIRRLMRSQVYAPTEIAAYSFLRAA